MTSFFDDAGLLWAALLVIALPIVIIGAGELEERLRYRDSRFLPAVSILRTWILPLFAIWAVLSALLGTDAFITRVVGSALLLAITAAVLAVLRVIIDWVRERPKTGGRRQLPRLLLAVPRLLVILVAAWLLVVGVWDLDLSSLLTALGVTSLVVSVALQDTLSGIASGFLLMSDHPFQPGDWIQAGDVEGRVVDMNYRSSRIEDRDGDLVIIPNSQLATATIINYDEPTRRHRVEIEFQVAYVNPPTLAIAMILDAARSTPGVLEDPPPTVKVVQIDDPLMGYKAQLWIDDYTIAPRVKSDFSALIWYQSHRHEVPLPSPAYDLYISDAVEAAAAGQMDRAEIRRRLRRSSLLDQLGEDDLDRLAVATRPVRFARGEVIVDADAASRDLYVLWGGRARLVLDDADGSRRSIAELSEGDIFGLLSRSDEWDETPRVVAITDCEVLIIGAEAAGGVASRNPALAEALNQLMATRRRRVERMLRERFSVVPSSETQPAIPTDATDETAGGRS
jgi:small-conductance mechanosensitive channel/CRP-like cAMP-binding protein